MSSLVSVPVPSYKIGSEQFQDASVTDFITTFRNEPNSFISNNDKLHHWTMWRTNVNSSFIRNLPVDGRSDHPIYGPDVHVREKRINIERFLVHSDTDDLKRLEMKETYGTSDSYPSQLGHSTYFLYGIPRIIIREDRRTQKTIPPVIEKQERLPQLPPRPHLFVGSSQHAKTLANENHRSVELSHAQKSSSVFQNKLTEPESYNNRQSYEREGSLSGSRIRQERRVTYGRDEPPQISSLRDERVIYAEQEPKYLQGKKMYLIKDHEDEVSVHNFTRDSANRFNEDDISNSSEVSQFWFG